MHHNLLLLAVTLTGTLGLFTASPEASAATLCVEHSPALTTALVTAATNNENDQLRIVQGHYVGDFVFDSSQANTLSLLGGYTPGCASRTIDPSNTVLYSMLTDTAFSSNAPNMPEGSVIEGLTLSDGGMTLEGGSYEISTFEITQQVFTSSTSVQIHTMYIGYFGRGPAATGAKYYARLMEDDGDYYTVIDDFWESAESAAIYAGLDRPAQVDAVFQNLFGRNATPQGRDYWVGLLTTATVTLPELPYTIGYSAAAADLIVLDAKRAVSQAVATALNTAEERSGYAAHLDQAREMLNTVRDTARRDLILAHLDTIVANIVGGKAWNAGL